MSWKAPFFAMSLALGESEKAATERLGVSGLAAASKLELCSSDRARKARAIATQIAEIMRAVRRTELRWPS